MQAPPVGADACLVVFSSIALLSPKNSCLDSARTPWRSSRVVHNGGRGAAKCLRDKQKTDISSRCRRGMRFYPESLWRELWIRWAQYRAGLTGWRLPGFVGFLISSAPLLQNNHLAILFKGRRILRSCPRQLCAELWITSAWFAAGPTSRGFALRDHFSINRRDCLPAAQRASTRQEISPLFQWLATKRWPGKEQLSSISVERSVDKLRMLMAKPGGTRLGRS